MDREAGLREGSSSTGRRIVAAMGILILFAIILGASVPYLLHLALGRANQVKAVETIEPSEIPNWVLTKLGPFDDQSQLHLVRLEHARPASSTDFLTREGVPAGRLVWMVDEAQWRVDWRIVSSLGEQTDMLGTGSLSEMTGLWERVERICAYNGPTLEPYGQIGAAVYLISIVSIVVGPLLLGLYLLRTFSGRLKLWHLLTVGWCYSFYLFLFTYFSSLEPAYESTVSSYLGYSVFIIPLVVVEVWRYERSKEGRDFLSRLWNSRHRFAFEGAWRLRSRRPCRRAKSIRIHLSPPNAVKNSCPRRKEETGSSS